MQCMKSNARRSCSCYASPGPWWWTWLWYVGLSSNYIHVGTDIVWHPALYVNISYQAVQEFRTLHIISCMHDFPSMKCNHMYAGPMSPWKCRQPCSKHEHDMLALHGLNWTWHAGLTWTELVDKFMSSMDNIMWSMHFVTKYIWKQDFQRMYAMCH